MKIVKIILFVLLVALIGYLLWGVFTGGFRAKIVTQVDIDAPAEDVWASLIDLDNYEAWNPFIQPVEGSFSPGESVKLHLKTNEADEGMSITPKVLDVNPRELLRWKGTFLLPFVFDGNHEFRLERLSENKTRLHQSEAFEGLLIPFARLGLLKDTAVQFENMNQALKQYVEQNR